MKSFLRTVLAGCGVFVMVAGSFPFAPLSVEASHRTETRESSSSRSRMSSSLRRKINALDDDPVMTLRVPILMGVGPGDFGDTWGEARSNGRSHEGTDIMAPRGAFIVSPTEAVVTSIGVGANGGNYVYTTNPGGERFYYAHLDDYADDLDVGDVLGIGDLIGYVGNTGNASGGAPHLHLGIYTGRGAVNPFPRLTNEFSLEDRVDAITKILEDARDEDALARTLVAQYRSFFIAAQADEDVELPKAIVDALPLARAVATNVVTRDLTLGSQGPDVAWLQTFLIEEKKGFAARDLGVAGATGYFGPLTRAALVEYQTAAGIAPASGYFGPLTRARLLAAGALNPQ